jgi:hypothetical protein
MFQLQLSQTEGLEMILLWIYQIIHLTFHLSNCLNYSWISFDTNMNAEVKQKWREAGFQRKRIWNQMENLIIKLFWKSEFGEKRPQ